MESIKFRRFYYYHSKRGLSKIILSFSSTKIYIRISGETEIVIPIQLIGYNESQLTYY